MDWSELYLFTLILMRVSGMVLFNPILGRNSLPNLVKAGMIMVFSGFVLSMGGQRPHRHKLCWSFASECCWSWA